MIVEEGLDVKGGDDETEIDNDRESDGESESDSDRGIYRTPLKIAD
jgi:hypothetical protein